MRLKHMLDTCVMVTLFAGFVVRMEETILPKYVMFRELVGGVVFAREGAGKGVDGVSSRPPRSFRSQDQPVDNRSFRCQTRGRRNCS